MGKTFLHSLTLINFQKYKNSQLVFSPYGNLIAGLNGSGKSTIAAAIALVFGGTSKTIGKTLAAHELIKYGEAKATAEIVIKTSSRNKISEIVKIKGKEEIIDVSITRTISAGGSSYKINNIPASLNQIKEVAEALDIHINSLGQFLPQDKVTEFSGLAEEEQLETTIKTCKPELLEKKKELEEISDNLEMYAQKHQVKIEQRNQLKTRIEALEKESSKLKDFLERQQQIKMLQCKIKLVEYSTIKGEYEKEKAQAEREKKEYEEKQKEIEKKEVEYTEEKEKLSIQEEENRRIIRIEGFEEKVSEIKRNEAKEKACGEKIDLIMSRTERIAKEKFEISQWKEGADMHPPALKLTKHLEEELKVLEEENRRCRMQDSAWQVESSMKAADIKNIEVSIKKEEERETRIMERLKTLHKDTYTVIKLMQSSERQWKVDMPAIITMQITKEEYKEELSSQLNLHALTCFVCHTREEFQEFVKEFKDRQNLAVNAVEKQNSEDGGHQGNRSSIRDEVLLDPKYKMTYLSECIEAPPAVKEFLNIFSKLSSIPATKIMLKNEHEFFSTYRTIGRIISNKRVVEIKRSPYTKDETLSIFPMAKGIDIIAKPEDTKLKERLAELKEERESRTKKRQEVLNRREAVEKRIKELAHLRETDIQEKEKYERKIRAAKAHKDRAEEIQNEEKELKKEEDAARKELWKIKEEGKKIWPKLLINELIKAINEFAVKSRSMQTQYEYIEKMGYSLLAEKQKQKELYARQLKKEEEVSRLKARAMQKQTETYAIHDIKPDDNEIKLKLKEMPQCINTLANLLAQEKAKAELSVVDYSAIDEHEECKAFLQKEEKILRKEEKEKEKYESIKKQKEADLMVNISALIKDINENASKLFDTAGVKAEVHVEYGESPRKWRLVLKVQFRTEGKPEVLSEGRHSGGEKAVSIILYLLSMQKLSKAPFLLVDEINQGMDAGHEKIVHSMLLGSKSSSDKQVIVITPKIIPGLDYTKRTRVHIIIET